MATMMFPVMTDKAAKQGYLGELRAKSTQELAELLKRQQQIKTNV